MDRWYWARVISLDDRPARTVANTVRTTGVAVRMLFQKDFGWDAPAGDSGNESLGNFIRRSSRRCASTLLLAAGKFNHRLELLIRLDGAWFQLADPVDGDLGSGSLMDQVRGQDRS